MRKNLFLLILTVFAFSACTSLKGDIYVNSDAAQAEANLKRIEAAIVPLEAGTAANRQSAVTSARQMITGLEREVSADIEYTAKLTAWSGRLSLIENRYSEAQRLYRQSSASSAGNIPSIILGFRLEGDPARRLEMIDKEILAMSVANLRSNPGYAEIHAERGRTLYELNRFSESAGAFDSAFSAETGTLYRDNYKAQRDNAWELRNSTGVNAGTMNMLRQDVITWNDCLTMTKTETQLLRFITGGREMQNSELFTRLTERAFIPSVQDITVSNWGNRTANINDTVTRAGAAWFIWHLYAEARADRGLLTRYSSRYAAGANPRSPVPDVPPLSPFLDSILGSVETEFLSLPDGTNFRPSQEIRASELLAILRKIDN